ncbi:MAG: hypothetical protein ACRC8E_10205, partial [Plesiomonas shigelloides]
FSFCLLQFGVVDPYLGAKLFETFNFRALLFKITNFGFRCSKVFGGDAALAGDGLEGGGDFVYRPKQEL